MVNNELGDVGAERDEDHRRGAAAQARGQRPRRRRAARSRQGAATVLRPVRDEALPEVVSAERAAESAGSAEEATTQALARASQAHCRRRGRPKRPRRAATHERMDTVALDVHVLIPDNLVLRGRQHPARRADRGRARRHEHHGRRRHQRAQGRRVARSTLVGTVNTVRGTYEFQGRRSTSSATARCASPATRSSTRCSTSPRPAKIPNTGVDGTRAHHRHDGGSHSWRSRATPPLEESDILALVVFNRPVNELGTGERRRWRRRPAASRPASSPRRSASRSARRSTSISSRSRRRPEYGGLGAGVTLGQQVGDRAFVKLRQQFGERSTSEFMLEYQLARLPAPPGHGRAGDERLRQPRQPAPRGARRHRSDLLLQLLRGLPPDRQGSRPMEPTASCSSEVVGLRVCGSALYGLTVGLKPDEALGSWKLAIGSSVVDRERQCRPSRRHLHARVVEARAAAEVGQRIGRRARSRSSRCRCSCATGPLTG